MKTTNNIATIKSMLGAVYATADAQKQISEVLLGMQVEVLSSDENFAYVCTPFGEKGYIRQSHLCSDTTKNSEWSRIGKMMIKAPFSDVLKNPSKDSLCLATVPRGGFVHPVSAESEDGWLSVELPDGESGYMRSGGLMCQPSAQAIHDVQALRETVAACALGYIGAQYRHGGRSPVGVDSNGLIFMAYWLNGLVLNTDFSLPQDNILKKVSLDDLQMGDILYFDKHIGLFLGDGQYVHATDQALSDGVVINNLQASSLFYRKDLADSLHTCAGLR